MMGGASAFAAQGFKTLVAFFQNQMILLNGARHVTHEIGFIGIEAGVKLTLMIFIIAGVIALVLYITRLQEFHGVADTIEGVGRPKAQVDIKEGFVSTLVASLSIAGGAPVGQYGPLVHLGATIASFVSKFTNLARNTSEIVLACGVAGAISAAFGAPIAAILFVHEVVLRHFSLRTFAPVTVASVVAYVVMQEFFPITPFLPIINASIANMSLVVMLIIIGLGGGVVTSLFMQLCLKSAQAMPRLGLPLWGLPFIGAGLLCLTGLFIPQVLGTHIEIMHMAIAGELALTVLVIFCLVKLVLAALSIAFGFYGGVFAPALFIGIMFGAAMGQVGLISTGFQEETLGLFALAGMGAVISSTIGAPISTILIVLELTGDYSTTIGVMVSVVFSSRISTRLFGRSLFDRKLLAKGLDMSLSRSNYKLSLTSISELISQQYCRLVLSLSRDEMLDKLVREGFSEGYILGADDRLIGKITLLSLLQNKSDDDVLADMNNFISLAPSLCVLEAMEQISGFIGESLPIVSKDGKLCGVVKEGDIFAYYLRISDQSHAEEKA